MHHQRFVRHGDDGTLLKSGQGTYLKYFQRLVKIETDKCILWELPTNDNGYGRLTINGKRDYAHRLALIHHTGNPPKGKPLALHQPIVCHNRACLNYRHLYWGDYGDNIRDATLDGVTNQGEKCHFAKPTRKQVLEIRLDQRPATDISIDYNVSIDNVYHIKARRTWAWLD